MNETTRTGMFLIAAGGLALCGWGATTLSFAPEGANWTGGEGERRFEDAANWTRVASGTEDELVVYNQKADLLLEDDVSLTKLKLRGGYGLKPVGIDLRGHTLAVTTSLKLWDQDAAVSNGTLRLQALTLGEFAVPSAHLTLSNVTCALSASSLTIPYSGNSLTLCNADFDYVDSWNTGFAMLGQSSKLVIHDSCVETNSARTGALNVNARNVQVLVDGENSNVRLGYCAFGSEAANAVFSIRDGISSIDQGGYSLLQFESGATSNLVTVGRMKTPFFRTRFLFKAGSVGNRVVVEKGGAAGCTNIPETMPMSGVGNRIEVCDGCFTNSRVCHLATDLAADGNAIALKGDDATFVVGRDLVVGNRANTHAPMRFEFTPGEKGFNGEAPFRSIGASNYQKAISNLVISVNARAFVGMKSGSFRLPLMKFSSAPQRLEVDELNAVLESKPAGGVLSYDSTAKTLYWDCVRSPRGMTVVYR